MGRKPITSAIKPMKKSAKAVMDLFTAEAVTTILLVSVITVGVYFSKKRSEENYASNILIVSAVVYLALWAFFLVVFILGLVWKHKKESILFPCTMALYLPGLILMKPSAQYCARIVSGDVTTVKTVSQLFELFGPDLINYCVAVFLMAYHLQYLQRNELVVKPIAFIVEFFDMSKRAQKKYNFGQNSMDFSTLIALSSNNQCLHEDGGEMAIFERNTKGVSSLSNGAVLYGPAYKVVSCNCSVNTKLKSFAEWCDWCRCVNCGGKNLPRHLRDLDSSRTYGMPDLNSDLVLVVGLVVCCTFGMMYAHEQPYRHLYIMGVVGASFTLARIAKILGY